MSGVMGIVPVMMSSPVVGCDYPGSLPQLRRWFTSDEDCADYLDWLRWPEGFCCPWCAGVGDWSTSPGLYRCSDCGRRTSVTAGTIFHGTRTPLTVWFEAAWLMMTSKQGMSAQGLSRVAGLGSYQTAWTMLHKFRTVMGTDGCRLLSGGVEVDEMFIGGVRRGVGGRGAAGKILVAGAIEHGPGTGFGRARLQVIPDASAASLGAFLRTNVAGRLDGGHGCVEVLPGRHEGCGDGTRSAQRFSDGCARAHDTAGRAPAVLVEQACPRRHISGQCAARASAGVSGRVRVSLQPAHRSQAGPALPPAPGVRGGRQPGVLQRPRHQRQDAVDRADTASSTPPLAADPGRPATRTALAHGKIRIITATIWIPHSI